MISNTVAKTAPNSVGQLRPLPGNIFCQLLLEDTIKKRQPVFEVLGADITGTDMGLHWITAIRAFMQDSACPEIRDFRFMLRPR